MPFVAVFSFNFGGAILVDKDGNVIHTTGIVILRPFCVVTTTRIIPSTSMDQQVDLTLITSSEDENVAHITRTNVDKTHVIQPAISILKLFKMLPVSSKLRKIVEVCGAPREVKEMPKEYNGDQLFEFPPSHMTGMEGMQRAFDCHNWIRYTTSTMQGFPGVVRLSMCGGAFECRNINCSYLLSFRKNNSKHFSGRLLTRCPIGLVSSGVGSMKCQHCNHPPYCARHCTAKIYYCIPNDTRYTRMVIHLGFHDHEFGVGDSYVNMEKAQDLVMKKASQNIMHKPKRIQKDLAKELISDHLLATSSTSPIDSTRLDELLSLIEPTTNNRRYGHA